MSKLTALKVQKAQPGVHGDGGGLYLRVKPSGSRSWVLRVQFKGKRRDIGLGSTADLSLAQARDKAADLRRLARQGKDPVVERDRERVAVPTFVEAMDATHLEFSKGWSPRTAKAFLSSLKRHVVPHFGKQQVSDISASMIRDVLAPIWTEKPQIARKVRIRIVQVLRFSRTKGWRTEAVPDADEIKVGLSRQKRGGNFAAMPYADVPAFFADQLDREPTAGRLALLFTILTASRGGEVRNARWDQINLEAATWTLSADDMKMDRAHVAMLSSEALRILELARSFSGFSEYIFPGTKRGRPLSDMTLTKCLRTARIEKVTVHGFRSGFRDWAAERMPTMPAMVAEMALAHRVGTATEQAYLRSDLRDMRRNMMTAWSDFLLSTKAEATDINERRHSRID